MNKKNKNYVVIAFYGCTYGFMSIFVFGFYAWIRSASSDYQYQLGEATSSVLSVIALIALCSAGVLWFSGLAKLLGGWGSRTFERNLALTGFLFVGTIFACYYFYFLRDADLESRDSAE